MSTRPRLVAPATVIPVGSVAVTIVAVGTVAIAVIWPVIAIAIVWPVIAIAIIRVAIPVIPTAIGTTILSSPVANLFNGCIAFRLKRQSSVTLHHCRLGFP